MPTILSVRKTQITNNPVVYSQQEKNGLLPDEAAWSTANSIAYLP